MPELTLESIDWDQSGGGTPHAIPDLQTQLPARVRPYRTLPGSDRPDYVVCVSAFPFRYRPDEAFDWSRTQAQYRQHDARGQFLSVPAIVVCALFAGQQLHAGMRSLAVQVAFVVDNTVADDDRLDFGKCDHIGQGLLTDSSPAVAGTTTP